LEIWQTVWSTIVSEFSDIDDVAETTQIILRLLVAALLGGLLGFEREMKAKNAGMRTHMLVCLGAALFVLIPLQAGATVADLSRVLQGLVAGIGFLGAGAIILGNHGSAPRGLTTAAGIWFTAAIGVAAGMGRETLAVLSTFVALAVLLAVPKIAHLMRRT